ncbi:MULTISPECIES: Imm45 family immunity protein [Achromobacter]|uniref:Imm45 family immunity protein n=1 Tax=Achromobacter TaxID=222 RepID=UPI0015838020|nr:MULTISPECIES: Imm45 family immunity protein [Achromobacter]MEB3097689.1 Imm45 family immunity protein [Achromobacter sp. D10]
MNAKKIIESSVDSIQSGNILRVHGKYPYEEWVDFMVYEVPADERAYGLIVTSGYKAGSVVVHLPKESHSESCGLNKDWVVSNWSKWIYPECDVMDVYLIDGYVASSLEESR